MHILLSVLIGFAWIVISFVSLLMFDTLRDLFNLDKLFSNVSKRTKNILIRVYVVLGPISFALSVAFIFLWMAYTVFCESIKWFIDIDREDIL